MPAEEVALDDARGRVLAADVVAGIALPPFDNSAMDGYAVRAAEVAGAPVDAARRVRHPRRPHRRPAAPSRAPPARIMTGAPLPAGADAIVPVEQTDGGTDDRARQGRARASARTCGGRRRTSRRATSCSPRARCCGPAQIGVAAAVGHARLAVRRRPVVLVLSTGSELVAPGRAAAAGPDLRVQRPDARRRGRGRGRVGRSSCGSSRTTSRIPRRARRAGGRAWISC